MSQIILQNIDFGYIGKLANQWTQPSNNPLQNAFGKVRDALNQLGDTARAATYGLRQEAPFERWFFDQGFDKPTAAPQEEIKARLWALLSYTEGLVRLAAEVGSLVLTLLKGSTDVSRHIDVLQTQAKGIGLSILAVLSPNFAKQLAHNPGGKPRIGASLIDWKWGSLYTGKLDTPLWHLESSHYPIIA
jgi:hypothetical protein